MFRTLFFLLFVLASCAPKVITSTQQSHTFATLECKNLPEDEFGTPRSEVYIIYSDAKEQVGDCLACQPIAQEDYSRYDIPAAAMSACGGWWAGGGDYYYVIREGSDFNVYAGWQDEGQMESAEVDTSFHWTLKKSFPINQ